MGGRVRVGIVGSQFISSIHADALQRCAAAELFAVASPTSDHSQRFAERHHIPHHLTDHRKMLEMDEIDMIVLGAPNDLHCSITVDAARAGKHVVCEKPECHKAGVKLMYAEELCFAPKYVRLKELLDSGALGKPVLIKQSEKHDGPHAEHFWDVSRSGGGVTMDMGCHAIEFFRWMLDRSAITSVYAQMGTYVHADRTRGDDNAVLILEFEGDVIAVAEESWSKLGGMDDRAEVHGSTPTSCTGMPLRRTALPATTMPSRRQARLRAGHSRSMRRCGITASHRSSITS
jgi:predicted dehydrogenase